LSTTLAVALLTSGAGGATAWLARVGDSAAFVLADGQWQELFDGGDDDGLQGTATDVVPFTGDARHEPGLITTATAHIPWGAAIVLMTDGMANPLRDGPSTVAPALAEVLSPGARGELAPLGLAAAADFSRRGCQDDRTVLVAWSRAT
jgi:hypothetical protein